MRYKTKEMQPAKPAQSNDDAVTIVWTDKVGDTHSINLSIAEAQKMIDETDMTDTPIVSKVKGGFVVKIFPKKEDK